MSRSTSESSDETGSASSPRQQESVVSVETDDGQKVEVSVEEVAEELSLPGDSTMATATEGRGHDVEDSTRKKTDAFYFYQGLCFTIFLLVMAHVLF